jgi:DNA-binding CsgD family transcriptional regulator
VHLAEELYVRIFTVGCAFVIAGCGLALCFATLDRGAPGPTTALFVTAAATFAVAGLVHPRRVYCRLRSRSVLQLTPAAIGALAVLLDGPESECWWIALPLPWIVATLGSTPLAIGAATVTAIAWLAGTALGGQALITPGDLGVLPATAALPTYTLVACVLIDGFAGLVLRRHRQALQIKQHTSPPLRVPNLAAPDTDPPPTTPPPPAPSRPQPASRLTARQLEVTLLLRDGLHQTEIAACLGISTRQVERLLATARQRVQAATTTQLVAMLASGALAPATPGLRTSPATASSAP